MKFSSLVAVLFLLGSSAAFACSGNPPPNCQCVNNQWVVSTSVNVGVAVNNTNVNNNTNINNSQNNSVNKSTNVNGINGSVTGGTSSATGGTANAQGGAGGSVVGSGNSSNVNNVTGGNSSAKGGNQKQNQTQSINNSGNSTIAAGAVTNTVSGGAGGQGGQGGAGGSSTIAAGAVNASTGASTSSATANGSGNGNNATSITYENNIPKAPVNTAYSASLTSGMDTCLGSASGGGQTMILGLTFGKTYVDKNCVLIKQTQLLNENGLRRSACKRMQMQKEGELIKEAMKEAGEECPPIVAAPVVVVTPLPVDAVSHKELAEVEKRIVTHVVQK